MRKIKYPLVVSDFDGTLVRKDGTIGALSKKAITEYIANGGKFVFSSGRMPSSIHQRAKELGLKGVLSAYNGSAILDIETGNVLSEGKLDYELALEACADFERKGIHTHLYDFNKFYANMDNEPLRAYCKATNEEAIVLPSLSTFMRKTGFCPYKILIMVASQDLPKILAYITDKYGDRCYVTSSSRHFIELCCKTCSKGTSVEFFAKYFGLPFEKIIAIGDQMNDLPMLKTAGFGIAVKNCQESLKEKVLVFDSTNEEDAGGKIIEKYAYEEE